jgi:taurine dioxygenase
MLDDAIKIRLDWDERSKLREALKRYPLVHIAAPRLTSKQFLNEARALGPLRPAVRNSFQLPGFPDIMVVGNIRDKEGNRVSGSGVKLGFHSDATWRPNPAEFSALYAVTVPEFGGNTEFSGLYKLYSELDDDTRKHWSSLQAIHLSQSQPYIHLPPSERSCLRPLIQHHPDSGRGLVFACPGFMVGIEGVGKEESDEILERLSRDLEPPEVVHHWRKNDLLVWGNRAIVHRATYHDENERRYLWRTSIGLDGSWG